MHISRIWHDPLLPGECLLKPAKALLTHKPNQIWRISSLFWVAQMGLASPIACLGSIVKSIAIYAGYSSFKRKLIVQTFSRDSNLVNQVAEIASQWQKVAALKLEHITSPKEKAIFSDSERISHIIVACTNQAEANRMHYDTIIVCRDEQLKQPQAIALTQLHVLKTCTGDSLGLYMKVMYLATNPANIRSSVNAEEYARVQGAASAILSHLKSKCLTESLEGIYLESVSSAKLFYKAHRFTELNGFAISMLEPNTHPMQLLTSKMK